MHPDIPSSADPRRRFLLKSSAALLIAGAGLGDLPTHADENPPASPLPEGGPAPIFRPSTPWLEPPAAESRGELPTYVKPREAWGAEPPALPYVPHTPTRVTLHHTGAVWSGTPRAEQALRNVQAFHVGPQREWEDIAYHFLIDLEANVWAGRPPTVRGNPSIYYDSIGLVLICFLGDYGIQDPTEAQTAAAASTAAWIIRRFNLAPDAITGHRDHAPTTCPGGNVYRLLQEGIFARQVRTRLG